MEYTWDDTCPTPGRELQPSEPDRGRFGDHRHNRMAALPRRLSLVADGDHSYGCEPHRTSRATAALTHSPERRDRPHTGTTRQKVLPACRPAGHSNCHTHAYTTPTAPAFRFALFRVRPQAPSVNFSICRLHSALLVVRFHDNRRFLQEKRIFSCGRQHFASVKTPPFLRGDSGRSPRKPRAVARDRKDRVPQHNGQALRCFAQSSKVL